MEFESNDRKKENITTLDAKHNKIIEDFTNQENNIELYKKDIRN